jgi:hypothetical protein
MVEETARVQDVPITGQNHPSTQSLRSDPNLNTNKCFSFQTSAAKTGGDNRASPARPARTLTRAGCNGPWLPSDPYILFPDGTALFPIARLGAAIFWLPGQQRC